MFRIFCNGCYTFFSKDKLFSLTSCGHVYCSNCLPNGNRYSNCKICKRKFAKMFISKQMPESTQMLFKDLKRNVVSFQKVIRFQSDQSECLIQHLLKENERLKRLVSCFKKRVEFLMKNAGSQNIARQMYSTIKQEPMDDDYNASEFSVIAQLNQLNQNEDNEMKENQPFDDIDWNENVEQVGGYDKKTVRFTNKNIMPKVESYSGQKQTAIPMEMRKIGLNMNSVSNKASISNQSANHQNHASNNDAQMWNYQQAMYHLNLGGGIEKMANPVPNHQATLDQFLLRGNSLVNSNSVNHFPLTSQSITNMVNYPNTVLSTRSINAKTLNQAFQ